MVNYELLYLVCLILYFSVCFFRCKTLRGYCQRGTASAVPPEELNPEDRIRKSNRERHIKKRIIVRTVESNSDIDASDKDEDPEEEDSAEKVSAEKEVQESVFKPFFASLRSCVEPQENSSKLFKLSSKTCPICIDAFEIGDEICCSRNSNCPHVFHTECMVSWLMKHNDCPLCRADYLIKDEEEEENESCDLESGNGGRLAFPIRTLNMAPLNTRL